MKLIWNIPGIIKNANDAGRSAVGTGGMFILEEANKTIPYLTGAMEASGAVSTSTSETAAVVSYDTEYAVRQHETHDYAHAPGRRWMWLTLTAGEQADEYAERVAEAFRKEWGTV